MYLFLVLYEEGKINKKAAMLRAWITLDSLGNLFAICSKPVCWALVIEKLMRSSKLTAPI